MPEGRWPRGVTPCPSSGAAAESARLQRRRTGREQLPHIRGQGRRREEISHALKPEARGGGREELPHVQGAMAAQAQEGLEELSHVEGQEGRW